MYILLFTYPEAETEHTLLKTRILVWQKKERGKKENTVLINKKRSAQIFKAYKGRPE